MPHGQAHLASPPGGPTFGDLFGTAEGVGSPTTSPGIGGGQGAFNMGMSAGASGVSPQQVQRLATSIGSSAGSAALFGPGIGTVAGLIPALAHFLQGDPTFQSPEQAVRGPVGFESTIKTLRRRQANRFDPLDVLHRLREQAGDTGDTTEDRLKRSLFTIGGPGAGTFFSAAQNSNLIEDPELRAQLEAFIAPGSRIATPERGGEGGGPGSERVIVTNPSTLARTTFGSVGQFSSAGLAALGVRTPPTQRRSPLGRPIGGNR